MTISDLKNKDLIILECISGSRAYGLDTPNSDTDIKGVFLLPRNEYYGLNYIPQVSDEKNDIIYYEFSRFMELLSVNNPNILELLSSPKSVILKKHPLLNEIKPEIFLSKLCKNTFGKFALSQIKKAKGLKKKIVNPIAKEKKSILSFCYVNYDQGSIPLEKFLERHIQKQEDCGLVNITNMKDIYGLYFGNKLDYRGIIKNKKSTEVSLSSIPKGEKAVGLLYYNKDGYSTYCKEYCEYWDWVEKRNDSRYENTLSHGKNYDAKNMMHTFRLLEMAIEIGKYQKINVIRENRALLLGIKNGDYEYDELLQMAEERQNEMERIFDNSPLPDKPDMKTINELTFQIRDKFYKEDGNF